MSALDLKKIYFLIIAAFALIAPAAAQAQQSRVIKFTSECSRPIEFIIRNNVSGNGWASHGWYNLRPNQDSTFSDNGITLRQSDDFKLYFYARATDGSDLKWTGSNNQTFQGTSYPFMEVNTAVGNDGQLLARITCPGAGGSGSGGGSYSSGGRTIKLFNDCSHPIEFIIRNAPNGAQWASHGWYNLKAGANSTFTDNGVTLTQDDDYSLYFWARSTDGSNLKWTGSNNQDFQGQSYAFMEMTVSKEGSNQLVSHITCGDAAPPPPAVKMSRVIKFYNDCPAPIEFIVRNNASGNGWASHGWYKLRPNWSSTFQDVGGFLKQSDGFDLYVYGRSTDGSGHIWQGDNKQSFGSQSYNFLKVNTQVSSDGQVYTHFTCDK